MLGGGLLLLLLESDLGGVEVFELPLKSVTYQPVPLSAKDERLSCFTMGPLPQASQWAGAGSVDFCMISTGTQQASHWYSYMGIKSDLQSHMTDMGQISDPGGSLSRFPS